MHLCSESCGKARTFTSDLAALSSTTNTISSCRPARKWHSAGPWCAAYVLVLISRLILIVFPPAGHVYNVDEMTMLFSTWDRFLGVPSVAIAWPSTILQLLTLPLFGVHLAVAVLFEGGSSAPSLSNLADALGRVYLYPWPSLTTMRFVSATIGSAAPILAAYLAGRFAASTSAAIVTGTLVAVSGVLWQHSAMATGDGASLTFALLAAIVASPYLGRRGNPFGSGLLCAVALASKVTVLGLALLSMFVVMGAPGLRPIKRLQALACWAAGTAIGFVALCPYVWLDPLRFLKGTVGNAMRGSSQGFSAIMFLLEANMGIFLYIVGPLGMLGLVAMARKPAQRWVAVALTATLLVIGLPLLRAGTVYARYGLPLVIPVYLLAGVGYSVLTSLIQSRRQRGAVAAMFGVFITVAVARQASSEWSLRQDKPQAITFHRLRAEFPSAKFFLPYNMLYEAWPSLTRADLTRMIASGRERIADPRLTIEFLGAHGLDRQAAAALIHNFDEDQQAMTARFAVMERVAPSAAHSIHFYYEIEKEGIPRLALVESYAPAARRRIALEAGPAVFISLTEQPELRTLTYGGDSKLWVYVKPGKAILQESARE